MYKVIISPSANADLCLILKYIAYELENPQAASEFADEIEKCYGDLENMPSAHALCADPFLRFKGYRKCPVGNYIVVFRIDEIAREVRVVHVFHQTQNYIEIQRSEA